MLLTACADSAPGGAAARVRVVASFYPIFEAARHVGGDRAQTTNLTPGGAEPHDLELTAGDLAAVQQADLVLYLGEGFQPAVERAVRDRGGPSIDLLEGLDLVEGESDPHDEGDEEHGPDPHVWLDPVRLSRLVDRIGRALREVDAEGAGVYASNAAAYRAELDALHGAFASALRDCERDVFVVSHAAFGYLAARYGLDQEAIAGLSPESEPTPARLAELRDLVRKRGVTVVFGETLASPRVAETLAREAGVRIDVLDPIEGLTAEQERGGATYASVMRDNLAKLGDALGCKG